jgi:hypothetical protein
MQRTQKVPIILAALLFLLAAVAEIAVGRSPSPTEVAAVEQARLAALARVEDALARQDVADALRAWQKAYAMARAGRSWRGLLDAADAHLRIAAVAGASAAAAPRAREIYMAALARARAERSVDGTVRAAEAFAALGDREVTELALRVAASLAARSRDTAAASRVETARARLLDRRTSLARITL